MNTLFLAIALGLVIIWDFYVRKLQIIHPAILFSVMFFLNSVLYLIWIPTLPDIEINTAIIVFFFCLTFSLASKVKIKKNSIIFNISRPEVIKINKKWTYIWVVFCVTALTIYYFALRNIVGLYYGATNSFADVMVGYSSLSKFTTEDVSVPAIVKLMKEIVYASGYVFAFITVNNAFAEGKRKIAPVSILIITLSALISLLNGSRSESIRLLLGIIVLYFTYSYYYASKKKRTKSIFKVLCVFLLLIFSFKMIGNIMGRNNTRTLAATLLMYMGGPLKNLDLVINSQRLVSELPGQITFAYQYRNLANISGNTSFLYDTSLPFTVIKGIDLGNVYTAIAVYITDFGYVGAFLMLVIMGIITGWLYRKSCRSAVKTIKPMWLLIYAFMAYTVLMEGFSEKFFGAIASMNIYRHFLFFYLLLRVIINRKQYKRLF